MHVRPRYEDLSQDVMVFISSLSKSQNCFVVYFVRAVSGPRVNSLDVVGCELLFPPLIDVVA